MAKELVLNLKLARQNSMKSKREKYVHPSQSDRWITVDPKHSKMRGNLYHSKQGLESPETVGYLERITAVSSKCP